MWQTEFFCHFGLFFALLPPPNNPENQNFEKILKKPFITLPKCTKNYDQMMYGTWDMVRDRCKCYFSFWAIFCPFYPPNSLKNQNLKKIKKLPEDIIALHKCTKSYDHMIYESWYKLHNRQTDKQKKWHIEVGAPPKKQKIMFKIRRDYLRRIFFLILFRELLPNNTTHIF